MRQISRRDLVSAVITGATTGGAIWGIFSYLGIVLPFGIHGALLFIFIPILWIFGVQLGYSLGLFWPAMEQFGRYCAVGFTNASVDFGVLYIFIAATGVASGLLFSVFKTISFFIAVSHSYFWNKQWAFYNGNAHESVGQLKRFIFVNIAAMVVNVTTSSIVIMLRVPNIDIQRWAGISAIVGSAVALIFSFIGFRRFVFRARL